MSAAILFAEFLNNSMRGPGKPIPADFAEWITMVHRGDIRDGFGPEQAAACEVLSRFHEQKRAQSVTVETCYHQLPK